MNSSHAEILRTLRERIQEIESAWHSRNQPATSQESDQMPKLAALATAGGSLVELLSAAQGAGVWTLALIMAKQVCGGRKVLVVVDRQRCFYPPAAAKMGIDLERLILVRPTTPRDVFSVAHQSLRCAAVGAVVGWHDRLSGVDARRLQLAAETGGGVGFLLRSATALRAPSFAALRLLVAPMLVRGVTLPANRGLTPPARRVQVDIVRCRGGKSQQSVILEIDDEKGHVRLPAEMAAPAPAARPARASG
jgi:hypothetical protein